MKLTARVPAPPGVVFYPGCFDEKLGKAFGVGRLLEYEISESGHAMIATFDCGPTIGRRVNADGIIRSDSLSLAEKDETMATRQNDRPAPVPPMRRRSAEMPYVTRLHDKMRETGLTHAELRQRGLINPEDGEERADEG